MLSIEKIHEIAEANNIEVTNSWQPTSAGRSAPRCLGMILRFREVKPQAWAELLSDIAEVPLTVYGTRVSTSSGATDNRLDPAYAALLPAVNARRAELGLSTVRN